MGEGANDYHWTFRPTWIWTGIEQQGVTKDIKPSNYIHFGCHSSEDAGPRLLYFTRGLLQRSSCRVAEDHSSTDTSQCVLNAAARLVTTVACRVYFTTCPCCTGLTSPNEPSTSLLLWFAGVWRTKLRGILERLLHSGHRRQQSTPTYGSVNQHQLLTVPRCRRVTFGHRAFSVADPSTDGLELTTDWVSGSFCRFWCFRRIFKTILFARY